MPELNFRVKIIGGRKTATKVVVTCTSEMDKSITFDDLREISNDEFSEYLREKLLDRVLGFRDGLFDENWTRIDK